MKQIICCKILCKYLKFDGNAMIFEENNDCKIEECDDLLGANLAPCAAWLPYPFLPYPTLIYTTQSKDLLLTCSVLTSPPVLLGAGGRMSWFL